MVLTRLLLLILTSFPFWQEQHYSLSVDVELVQVSATVIDQSGKYIEGLTADDFQLLEDGRKQKISVFSHEAQVPISLGVLVDISGSLQDKLQQALQAVHEIAANLSHNDEMFIITFNSRAEVRQKFTTSTEEIHESLRNIRSKGETAVYDAISLGLNEMKSARHRKRILLLVSDCFDTRSKIKPDQIEDLIQRSNILIYAIGIDDDNPGLGTRKRPRYRIYDYMLTRLTNAGNGRLVRLSSSANHGLAGLARMITGELHQQYTVGYYPSAGSENEGLRSIEVRVVKPGARILGENVHLVRRDPHK